MCLPFKCSMSNSAALTSPTIGATECCRMQHVQIAHGTLIGDSILYLWYHCWIQHVPTSDLFFYQPNSFGFVDAACPNLLCYWMHHVQLSLAAIIECSMSNLCCHYWRQHVQLVVLLLKATCPTYLCYYYWMQRVQFTCATIIGCSVSKLCYYYWMQCAQLTIVGCSIPNLLVLLDTAYPPYSPLCNPTHYWMGVFNYEAILWSVDMCLSGTDGQPVIMTCCIVQ